MGNSSNRVEKNNDKDLINKYDKKKVKINKYNNQNTRQTKKVKIKIPGNISKLTVEELYYKTYSETMAQVMESNKIKIFDQISVCVFYPFVKYPLFFLITATYNTKENCFNCLTISNESNPSDIIKCEGEYKCKIVPGIYSLLFSFEIQGFKVNPKLFYRLLGEDHIAQASGIHKDMPMADIKHLIPGVTLFESEFLCNHAIQPAQVLEVTLKRWDKLYKNLFCSIITACTDLPFDTIVLYIVSPFIFPTVHDAIQRNYGNCFHLKWSEITAFYI